MPACTRLSFWELNHKLQPLLAGTPNEPSRETSKGRHGVWIRERESGDLGRIAYELVDGPLVVLWGTSHEHAVANPSWSICRHDDVEILYDRTPETWDDKIGQSGPSVASLFATGGLHPDGVVRWGTPVPLDAPGVYMVALTNDADTTTANLPAAPIGDNAMRELLARCGDLKVDRQRPDLDEFRERLGAFWIANQTVLYVGKAGTSVKHRVAQYYSTPLGARSPHAGGWFLKTLANLDELFVHFAASSAPEDSERRIIDAFMASVPPELRVQLLDPERPLPFANLQIPGGARKRHGITGATGCRAGRSARPSSGTDDKQGATMNKTGARITLHEEIIAILISNGDGWMTTAQLADEVRKRGIYKKRDGTSDVTKFQIHGRTKNYPHLFERDGIRVRRTDR